MKQPIYKGRADILDSQDIARVAYENRLDEDIIHAILDVESKGRGYDKQGRITMLFEPHVFYRELKDWPKRQHEAQTRGLAYPKWGTKRYPKNSYPRIDSAMGLDPDAALRSASWGLGQIMGFNHKLVGYETPAAMVQAFAASEYNQLVAIMEFIKSRDLKPILDRISKTGGPSTPADWAPFAEAYNGKGYRAHNYHGRLSQRFNWWLTKPDTPYREPKGPQC